MLVIRLKFGDVSCLIILLNSLGSTSDCLHFLGRLFHSTSEDFKYRFYSFTNFEEFQRDKILKREGCIDV